MIRDLFGQERLEQGLEWRQRSLTSHLHRRHRSSEANCLQLAQIHTLLSPQHTIDCYQNWSMKGVCTVPDTHMGVCWMVGKVPIVRSVWEARQSSPVRVLHIFLIPINTRLWMIPQRTTRPKPSLSLDLVLGQTQVGR